MANAPEFTQAVARTPRDWLPVLGSLAVALLIIALAVQVLVADRARLAADAQWRPRMQLLCGALGCILPPWHEPTAFHIIARDLRPHPTAPGALLVTASFRNDAAFAQAWPQLQLSLGNLDGEPLGLRRFAPREYLGQVPANALIEPGQSASISLEVLDPGKRAVSFEFDFH